MGIDYKSKAQQSDLIRPYQYGDSWRFFDAHEAKLITTLVDIIIPRDHVSGSATEADVHKFIDFILVEMPEHQTAIRGGLKWLDAQCFKKYDAAFCDCGLSQQYQMIDEIAYPEKVKPFMTQGVAFFSLLRNLTCTGFYTSQIGIADIGYLGLKPNKWEGVPQEVLDQYGLK